MKTAPLTKAQYGLYAECAEHQGEICYNIPFIYVLDGGLDEARLKAAIEATVAAHPTLFTRIALSAQGDPVQTIDDSETFSLEVEHVADIEAEKQRMITPFDIYHDRLFRMRLLKDSRHFYFFIEIHHLICDGTSLQVMLHDIDAAYGGNALQPEAMTLADMAIEEEQLCQTPAFEEGRQWYAQNFDCGDCYSPFLPDQDEAEPRDGLLSRKMSVSLASVDAYCKEHGIFRSTFFTAVYSYLLAKCNNEQESLFSTVFSGRTDERLSRTVGILVKTLPVYAKFSDDTTVLSFLKAGQEQMTGCRQHEAYSYADALHDLNLQIGSFFAWHGTVLDHVSVCGKPSTAQQLCNTTLGVPFYVKASIVDGHCRVEAEYKANLYSEQLVGQFLESYEAVVEGFLREEYLRDVNITTPSQLELLDGFNQTDVPYDATQTIVSLFSRQAASTPDNIAVVYEDRQYTYAQVNDISDRLAAYVRSKGLGAEDVVSVLIPRSEWMAIASLGVLKAGCAYQPLDPSYPKERLNFMMQDASAKLLIADEALRPIVDEYAGDVLLTSNILSLPEPVQPVGATVGPDSLFILLYTSGSTGVPKGCQLTHANLVAFCHWYQRHYGLGPGHRVAAYASYGFDACMMDMYPALTCGASVHIIPEELRLDLMALNDYFERHGITHSFMTTQVGYQFATGIDNHSLSYLSTGGEKLASLAPPANYTLVNLYGPTESTVCITSFCVKKTMKDIPIGAALDNIKLYVVDKAGFRLPVGVAGELWVAGPQVSRGYLNRPEKTAEVYVANPFDASEKYGRCYRTGDIVRYLPDGTIQFVGRKDGQVKIRGFRIELKEVEAVVRQFPGIKDATVQAFDADGGKFIAAYVVSDAQVDIEALNAFILEQKPPYMVPAVTMQIDAIPLNQNQKVNRKALPKPERKATPAEAESNAPMNVLEQEIHSIIAKIINTDDFGITTVLGYAGLTSIMAIKLAIQINKRFGVTLDSKTLAKTGTLQSIENEILARMMSTDTEKASKPAEEHVRTGVAPLSYAQIGVYVDCMKQPTSTVYNIPSAIRFPQSTDVQLLRASLTTVIQAHPQFQVHFDSQGGDIMQIIDASQPVEIGQERLSEADMPKYLEEFAKPFNLRQGPLYRMEIVTTEQNVYLLADVHHLIFDGSSFDLFLNQLCDLMNGGEIESEAFSYADFVSDEKAAEGTPSYIEARNFFSERLASVEGITEVPADLTNPIERGSASEAFCQLDFGTIAAFCKQNNITPAHLILAAVFYTLSRFTNNEQICITTISSGRSDLRIRNTVGMFVNTLALSAQIGDQSVADFLKETGKNFDDTLRHEQYPFAQIAADYDLSAEILFAYQIGVIDQYLVNGQKLDVKLLGLDAAKFRIAFFIQEKDGVPGVLIEYDNGRYSAQLMNSLAQSVSNAASAFVRQPGAALKSVSLLDAAQIGLLDSFNQTDVPYDATQTIVSLFRRQVQLTPDNMAVVYHDHKYTYREVDDLTERIATLLVAKGLGREDVVSILIPRCEWMPIAALGVLKAGCAYQPLDSSYPSERLNFMIGDAAAKLLIADEDLRGIVDEYEGDVLLTKDIFDLPKATQPVSVTVRPADLFILLYTSGSTGLPKGCQLEHANLVAFCHWYQRRFELQAQHRVSCYASYGFDCCMMDMYPALTCGASVYIIGDDIRLTLPEVNAYFDANHITHSFMTTQVAYQFATNMDNHSLLHLIAAGEKLASLAPPRNFRLHNGYGPTEGTILITEYEVDQELKDIPVGKPLDNSRLYIVDKQFNRLPQGALGELWISGPHVTRSYLNRPEKTAEVYIQNPFSDDPRFARIYRTGDIVRYLPDGNIQFVGRKDGQVKIRGFRIEMKEIEAVIRQYPGIKDVTVQAFDYENGGKYVAAYIVSDKQVDVKDLNAFIGKQKPSYMIPAATMQIDAIPLNQNQKVNRKALPAPVIQAADHEYVEPANDTERLFCKIFSDVLSMDKIGATDNFFELGGTSLMVTKVIIEADKAGHHVAYGDVFPHPTPRMLAQFVTGETPVADTDEEVTNFDYTAIDNLLQRNTVDTFLKGQPQQYGNVLLTGATGYLGIHVLRELIDTDAATITCLVRGKDQAAAEHRLKNLLFYYFEKSFKELFGSRLFVVNGDVTGDIAASLPEGHPTIDTVFNCAANVKHFSKGTDIEDVNIGGASRCVDFCLNTGARLVHVSTTSIGEIWIDRGDGKQVPQLDEHRLWFGQFLDNRYIHSKFLAERLVLDAVCHHGLSAKVMRVGNLAPRSYDGEFQVNFNSNSYMGRLKVYHTLGCCPVDSYDELTELSPIDEAAKAVVLLATTPKECTMFQPFNNHTELLGDVLRLMGKVAGEISFVEAQQFEQAIAVAGKDAEKAKLLSAMLAYQDMVHGQKAVFIDRDNRYTCSVLHRLGFHWSDTAWDYVERMLTTISGFGYFE